MTLESGDIEAIVRRLAQLVGPRAGLVDAKTVAAALQVERDWLYAHARELGAMRLGDGPRARLRFDLIEVRERVALLVAQAGEPAVDEQPRRRRRRPAEAFGVKLIQGQVESIADAAACFGCPLTRVARRVLQHPPGPAPEVIPMQFDAQQAGRR